MNLLKLSLLKDPLIFENSCFLGLNANTEGYLDIATLRTLLRSLGSPPQNRTGLLLSSKSARLA